MVLCVALAVSSLTRQSASVPGIVEATSRI
jgi:hypothetical protein